MKKETPKEITRKHITQPRGRILSSSGLINTSSTPFLLHQYALRNILPQIYPWSITQVCSQRLVQADLLPLAPTTGPLWFGSSRLGQCPSSILPFLLPSIAVPSALTTQWLLAPLASTLPVLPEAFIFYSNPIKAVILTSFLHLL